MTKSMGWQNGIGMFKENFVKETYITQNEKQTKWPYFIYIVNPLRPAPSSALPVKFCIEVGSEPKIK